MHVTTPELLLANNENYEVYWKILVVHAKEVIKNHPGLENKILSLRMYDDEESEEGEQEI